MLTKFLEYLGYGSTVGIRGHSKENEIISKENMGELWALVTDRDRMLG